MEPGFREGLGLQRSEETLWGSRINWTCRKEQNLDKEKREDSYEEWREEKDQGGNEVGTAGADFVCGGGWT